MTTNEFEYELLEIEWSLDYSFDHNETKTTLIRDDVNDTPTEIRPVYEEETRRKIIHDFIQNWRESHPEGAVFNKDLQEPIKVLQVSLREACKHSARSEKSTKAVLQLETILAEAKKIGESRTKIGDASQKNLEKMIIMAYYSDELGMVKLTVGVKRQTHDKIEYSITVPPKGTITIDPAIKITGKKKKTSYRKR